MQYWSGTSESGTYYDADFGSVETGLGPVVHSLRLQYWFGTSGRSGTYYEADFGSAETGTHSETNFESVEDDTGLGPMELYSL